MSRDQALTSAFGDKGEAFGKLLDGFAKVQFDAYAYKIKQSLPLHEQLSELSRKVPQFWLNALRNSATTATLVDQVDVESLKFLTDVKVVHDDKDVRDYTIEFHFSSRNPFFTNSVLSKQFTAQPPSPSDDTPTPSPYDLEADMYLLPSSTPISWTSTEHDLTKKAPRVKIEDVEEFDEFEGSMGSFFNLFGEEGRDEVNVSEVLLEWWSHAVEYAAGLTVAEDSGDEEGFGFDDEEDSEDDEDPNKEIDLESEEEEEEEERPKKKSKVSKK